MEEPAGPADPRGGGVTIARQTVAIVAAPKASGARTFEPAALSSSEKPPPPPFSARPLFLLPPLRPIFGGSEPPLILPVAGRGTCAGTCGTTPARRSVGEIAQHGSCDAGAFTRPLHPRCHRRIPSAIPLPASNLPCPSGPRLVVPFVVGQHMPTSSAAQAHCASMLYSRLTAWSIPMHQLAARILRRRPSPSSSSNLPHLFTLDPPHSHSSSPSNV